MLGVPCSDLGPEPTGPSSPAPRPVSRRGAIASLAACALPACATTPPPQVAAARPRPIDIELQALRDADPYLIVAGERLDTARLRRLYERHDFARIWTSRQAQADALVATVLRAGDHGLDPELFRAGLLQRRANMSPLGRDLLLSDAFLSYAQALAFGAVPPDRRKPHEALTPDPIDIAAALDFAISRRDPTTFVEALAPSTPTYAALRQALRRARTGGVPARQAAGQIRTLEANLERERWLPRALPAERAWVNVADQRLVLVQDDAQVFTSRVVVGDEIPRKQSPEFHTMIEAGFLNPPWIVPRDVVEAEILPLLARQPDYLARHDMVLLANGEIEQKPGPNAGLGLIMFDMPNRFDVYLHDTPDKQLFSRDNRRASNGCIRVQNPIDFAALVMKQPVAAVQEAIAAGGTTRHRLPEPVPVFVTYQTAFAGTGGAVEFRPDFYQRDADVWRALQREGAEVATPVAAPVARPVDRRRVVRGRVA